MTENESIDNMNNSAEQSCDNSYVPVKMPSKWKLFVKRTFDIFSSGAVIILLSPFFIFFTPIVAIAMRGNPFFIQKRIGKNDKIFKLIKYRTMTNQKDANGNLLPDADRLSKFGEIMRKFSIDELPELFNIFLGQMSVVGPRPLPVVYLPFYTRNQIQRHIVRPGLTGLAQIHGRNSTPWNVRMQEDVNYVSSLSFGGDLKIIFQTLLKVVKGSDVAVMGERTCVGDFYEEESCKNISYNEIGGDYIFGTEQKGDGLILRLDKQKVRWFDSGRSAISAVIADCNVKKAYLPSFTCKSVVQPFLNANVEVEFYQVNEQLNVEKGLLKALKQEKEKVIVFLQSYFGVYRLNKLKVALRSIKNAIVVEDITHAILNDQKFTCADYYIASVRKWGGFGEGGLVASKEELKTYSPNDNVLIDKLQNVAKLQNEYYINGDKAIKAQFRKDLGTTEGLLDSRLPMTISDAAMNVISDTDFKSIKRQRRANYKALDCMLTELGFIKPVFEGLKKCETPLYYAFYCDNRDEFQKYLIDRDIYCPVIWPKFDYVEGECDKKVDKIYATVLCFPIDQRFGVDDMKRIFFAAENFKNEVLSK